MKKILLLLIFGLIPLAGIAPVSNTPTIGIAPIYRPLETLFNASVWVESSGNDNAYNAYEKAFGCVQIRAIRLRDYNKKTGKRYRLKDCYNREISKEVWYYYATKFYPLDYEGISKAWNGAGKSNKIYWAKIKKRLGENKD